MTPDFEERRHDLSPHPPEGCSERRHCSDPKCREARSEWLRDEVIPQFEKKMYLMITGAVLACAASFAWLHDLSNSKLELRLRETYEDRQHHEEDIKRVEQSMERMGNEFAATKIAIIERLDRNLSEIQAMRTARR